MRWLVCLIVVVTLAACTSHPQRWEGTALVNPDLISREMSPELVDRNDPLESLAIPPPGSLRPCCAFGSGLRVSLGGVTVPGVEIVNTIGVDELGLHKYDNGPIALEASRPGAPVINDEKNGLVYTCRGGFIDTAHLRDWADMTLFLSTRVAPLLDTGGIIDLRDEGATRRVVIKPVKSKVIEEYGRDRIALPIAQWVAFQLSVWHEIVTWYGWSATGIFSEQASSFSPEDLYSNIFGIKLAGVLIYGHAVGSEVLYNESMNVVLPKLLLRLGAVPGPVAAQAAESVDGVWWNSKMNLPETDLVTRRNFGTGPKVEPWLVTESVVPNAHSPGVAAICGAHPRPISLRVPMNVAGLPIEKRATVEFVINDAVAEKMLPKTGTRTVTQADFPKLIDSIRKAARERFGPKYDQP